MKITVTVMAACAAFAAWGAKPRAMVEHTLRAPAFDQVYVSGALDVELRVSADSAGIMVVRAADDAYAAFERRHSDAALYLSMADGAPSIEPVLVYVAPSLASVSAAGHARVAVAGRIESRGPVGLVVSGPSEITAAEISALSMSASVTGSGHITVSGPVAVSHVNCTATGSGAVTVSEFSGETVSATLRGSGDVTVSGRASESAALVVKGSGTANTSGLKTPLVRASVFGSGEVIYNGTAALRASGKTEQIKAK